MIRDETGRLELNGQLGHYPLHVLLSRKRWRCERGLCQWDQRGGDRYNLGIFKSEDEAEGRITDESQFGDPPNWERTHGMGSSLERGARRILSSLGGMWLSDPWVWSPAQGSVWTSVVWLVVEIIDLGQTWSREEAQQRFRGPFTTPQGRPGPPGSQAARQQAGREADAWRPLAGKWRKSFQREMDHGVRWWHLLEELTFSALSPEISAFSVQQAVMYRALPRCTKCFCFCLRFPT